MKKQSFFYKTVLIQKWMEIMMVFPVKDNLEGMIKYYGG